MARPSLTVFLPCAGLGHRLRPLTNRIPKPLLPFGGKSALRINFERLKALNPQRILCNSHHLPEKIKQEADSLNIEVFHEPNILGTGGCLTSLKSELAQTDYFLVHNGDILHDIDLKAFWQTAYTQPNLARLVGINIPSINTLEVGPEQTLEKISPQKGEEGRANSNSHTTHLTFSGIALYQARFLDYCDSSPEDLVAFWQKAMGAGEKIRVENRATSKWFDFGEPQGLWEAAKWYHLAHINQNKIGRDLVINESGQDLNTDKLQKALILENPRQGNTQPQSFHITGQDFSWKID